MSTSKQLQQRRFGGGGGMFLQRDQNSLSSINKGSKRGSGLGRRRRETLRKITRERQQAMTEKSIQRMTETTGQSESKRRSEGEKLMKFLWKDVKDRDTDNLDMTLNHDVVELRILDPKGLLLKYAVAHNFTDVVAVLLRHNSPIESGGDDGISPVHLAIKLGYIPIFAMLITNNTALNLPSLYEKRTPLHAAVRCNRSEPLELLLSHGADPNKADIYGSTPLQLAARLGRTHLITTLLNNGADIQCIDNEGWTALHTAAEAGHVHTVRMLLEGNSYVDAQSRYGKTALHWAAGNGHQMVIEVLLEYHANVAILDLNNKKACEYVYKPAIRNLLNNAHMESKKKDKTALHRQKRDFIDFRLDNNKKSLIDLLDLSQYEDSYAHNLNVDTIGRGALKDAISKARQEKAKSMPYIMYDSDSCHSSVDELSRPRALTLDYGQSPAFRNPLSSSASFGSNPSRLNALPDSNRLHPNQALMHGSSSFSSFTMLSSDEKIDSNPICESLPMLSLGTILEERVPSDLVRFTIAEEPMLQMASTSSTEAAGSGTESSGETGNDVMDGKISPEIVNNHLKIFETPSPSPPSSPEQKMCRDVEANKQENIPKKPKMRPKFTRASQSSTDRRSSEDSEAEMNIKRVTNRLKCKVPSMKLIETLENLHGKVDDSVDENVNILNDVFRDVILLRQQAQYGEGVDRQMALENIEQNLKNVVIKLNELRGNFNCFTSEA